MKALLFVSMGSLLFYGLGEARPVNAQPTESSVEAQLLYDPQPVFQAADILPPALLKGEDYHIHARVVNEELLNRYELTTAFGPLTVEGTDLLKERIQEIQAIRMMETLKGTDVFKEAVETSATGPLKFAKGMVTAPIDTLSNVGTGIGKWLGNIGHSMWGGGSRHEEGTLKTILGFDTVKRAFAHRFVVDTYSSYPQLQEELNDVSWTAFAGSMTVRVAFSVIPGVAGTVVSTTNFSNSMRSLIADKSPSELKQFNEEKLTGMGIHESLVEVFLEHPQFSPTQKTFLVGALNLMDGVEKREIFIQAASLVQDETSAFLRRRQAEMMAAYHKQISPVQSFHWIGGAPVMHNQKGAVIVPLPVDHIAWTRAVAQDLQQDLEASLKIPTSKVKELWVAGTMSPLAQKNFEAKGWLVKEKVAEQLTLK
jgi:hypothetical protein